MRTRPTALLAVIVTGTNTWVHRGPELAVTESAATGAGVEREVETQTARVKRKGKSLKKNIIILSL
jgi:hypothetical protein